MPEGWADGNIFARYDYAEPKIQLKLPDEKSGVITLRRPDSSITPIFYQN